MYRIMAVRNDYTEILKQRDLQSVPFLPELFITSKNCWEAFSTPEFCGLQFCAPNLLNLVEVLQQLACTVCLVNSYHCCNWTMFILTVVLCLAPPSYFHE